MPSNETMAKVVLHDLNLLFQGQTFETSIGSASTKMYRSIFKYFLYINDTIVKVVFHDLDLLFKVKMLKC